MGFYFLIYKQHFSELRNKPIKLFELGIYKGESSRLWRDYFAKSQIIGLDNTQWENYKKYVKALNRKKANKKYNL